MCLNSALKTVLLIIVLLPGQILYAVQDAEIRPGKFWFNTGLKPLEQPSGPTFYLDTEPQALLSVTYQHDFHLLTLRYMVTTLLGFGLECEGLGDCTDYKDFSLLYGLSTPWQKSHASFSVGAGLTSHRDGAEENEDGNTLIDEFGQPINDTVKAIALALETQFFWRPLRLLGFGVYGSGNINSERHLLGAMLTIQFMLLTQVTKENLPRRQ